MKIKFTPTVQNFIRMHLFYALNAKNTSVMKYNPKGRRDLQRPRM
jgi:hypothetical protein